jgi:non-heme chloroperoxidase
LIARQTFSWHRNSNSDGLIKEEKTMSTITTKDGTKLFYKDWGSGQAVVFSHGWPLSADAWDDQLMFLAERGYRVVAHDRRGHGRSSQSWQGNDMDTYADDLAAVLEALDLKGATLVGHSTGGGEVARYIGRHGTARVAKAVLVSDITPLMLKTADNPGGHGRSKCSTRFAPASAPTARNSGTTCRHRSTAPTGTAPRSRRACATRSG